MAQQRFAFSNRPPGCWRIIDLHRAIYSAFNPWSEHIPGGPDVNVLKKSGGVCIGAD